MLVDAILELLKDGKWHSVDTTVKKFSQQENLIEYILNFMEDYGFIEYDKTRNMIMMDIKIQQLE
ncbi:MAG: hypothetical protein QG670_1537 [Thermoproteota archaeon]|nr:hypothetical protein [Thermoproteota archaeon]